MSQTTREFKDKGKALQEEIRQAQREEYERIKRRIQEERERRLV